MFLTRTAVLERMSGSLCEAVLDLPGSSEIAAELFLSPHTAKSQQMSLYRKLAVSTRSQAVARARELGLLEG